MHKTMQRAVRTDHIDARPQHQVKRVAENDFCADLAQLLRRHRLHRAIGPDRHERRRLDDAALERETPAAGRAVGGEQIELHGLFTEEPMSFSSCPRRRASKYYNCFPWIPAVAGMTAGDFSS